MDKEMERKNFERSYDKIITSQSELQISSDLKTDIPSNKYSINNQSGSINLVFMIIIIIVAIALGIFGGYLLAKYR